MVKDSTLLMCQICAVAVPFKAAWLLGDGTVSQFVVCHLIAHDRLDTEPVLVIGGTVYARSPFGTCDLVDAGTASHALMVSGR